MFKKIDEKVFTNLKINWLKKALVRAKLKTCDKD